MTRIGARKRFPGKSRVPCLSRLSRPSDSPTVFGLPHHSHVGTTVTRLIRTCLMYLSIDFTFCSMILNPARDGRQATTSKKFQWKRFGMFAT